MCPFRIPLDLFHNYSRSHIDYYSHPILKLNFFFLLDNIDSRSIRRNDLTKRPRELRSDEFHELAKHGRDRFLVPGEFRSRFDKWELLVLLPLYVATFLPFPFSSSSYHFESSWRVISVCLDNDDTPGFAISLKTMLDNFDGDAMAARKAYCGLEAIVKNPDGTQLTLYVADAFDDAWVLTPNSIDVMYNSVSFFSRFTLSKIDLLEDADDPLGDNQTVLEIVWKSHDEQERCGQERFVAIHWEPECQVSLLPLFLYLLLTNPLTWFCR